MDYFCNEEEALQIEGLSIENRMDRISLYGNLNIGRDKQGLSKAKLLLGMFENLVSVLEAESAQLPEKIEYTPEVMVKNPFE